jgi:small ligand-binding sensory domain FIST
MPLIRAGVGLSVRADTAAGAEEAGARAMASLDALQADWCVVFATAPHGPALDALLTNVSLVCGTPYVVGCSGWGVIAEGREVEEAPAIGVLAVASDVLRATPFLFRDEGSQGLTAGIRAGQRLMGSRGTRDLVLVWPDPFRVRPDRFLQGLGSTLGGIPVVGAAAAGDSPGGPTFQYCGIEAATGSVSGVRLGGEFRYRVGISQGCRSTGGPVRVTRAHDNLILELEGRPAYEVMRERVPEPCLRAPEHTVACVSVGLLPESSRAVLHPGEYLIRNIVAADPDTGILAIADTVEDGQSLVFAVREPRAARDDLESVAARLAGEEPGAPRFGLYFDCLARGRSLYGESGVDAEILSRAFPGLPILGFFGNAEIAPLRGRNQLFTYSGVLALVGE